MKKDKLFGHEFNLNAGHSKWLLFVLSLKWEKGCLDKSSYDVSLRGASLGVPEEVIYDTIARLVQGAGDVPNEVKIHSQIRRAKDHISAGHPTISVFPTHEERFPSGAVKEKPEYSAAVLNKFASSMVISQPKEFICSRSSISPSYVTSADVLACLYSHGEKVVIFTIYKSQGQFLWEQNLHPHQYVPEMAFEGVWFLTAPVDGSSYPNPRQNGKLSRRSEESITSFRFLLLESDKAESDVWLRALARMPLRIVAIYESGGRSIHALVRIDASSKADWDEIVVPHKPMLTTLGADPGALSAVRLSRLPQAWRGSRQQTLLYLNPNSDGTPILDLPQRPPHRDWCQWLRRVVADGEIVSAQDFNLFREATAAHMEDPEVIAALAIAREVCNA
ncbi:MAG: hypothetical protein JWM16_5650 [Verrucomicrobiales bacterium]|nr:hypothetical protein [Verrucomicrobiales bacterium]